MAQAIRRNLLSRTSRGLRSVAIFIFILLLSIEFAIVIVSAITPAVFKKVFGVTSDALMAIQKVEPAKFEPFAERARRLPTVWDSQAGSGSTKSCLGRTFRATYDSKGARLYPGYSSQAATVLLIGDSYTHGDEVGDEHSISARLYERTGIISANLGVGGYSSLQAVLKLERVAKEYPAAKVVVLGIMFENIRRNVNSYMATFTGEQGVLALRPYVRGQTIAMVPTQVFDGLDKFRGYATRALESDFWHMPAATFPYTLSMFKVFNTKHFWLRNRSRIMKIVDRQYEPDYTDAELTNALSAVMRRFGKAARAAKLQPLAIFIPQNRFDLVSPTKWIDSYRRLYGNDIDLRIMDHEGVEWLRYNHDRNGNCHPSPYGYDMIARAYAKALGKSVVGPAN